MAPDAPRQLSGNEQLHAIKTWRYLRLAMIALALGIFVSILFERSKTDPTCFQTSMSAYYYTPARGMFVGALLAIGACLVSLKGNTEREDVLLNLAGMFAPIVALVPTPYTGSCASVLGNTLDRDVNISNNVVALLALGGAGLLTAGLLMWREMRGPDRRATNPGVVGWFVALAAWLFALVVFVFGRGQFIRMAHYAAAILMFVCILAVVVSNAMAYRAKTNAATVAARNRYGVIAITMLVSAAVIGFAGWRGWDYWVLAIEAVLIALFAAFWIAQTRELWNEGLR